uniref:Uncharacterized protein n=1 Tax=Bos indicus x Bos taurus TaxID=30522 RepID=A0A4W2HPX1_BOBOX
MELLKETLPSLVPLAAWDWNLPLNVSTCMEHPLEAVRYWSDRVFLLQFPAHPGLSKVFRS